MNWKIIAIIFIALFVAETLFFCWGYYMVSKDEKNTNDCLYNFCAEYPDGYYESGLCECYDYDLLGNLIVAKTRYN